MALTRPNVAAYQEYSSISVTPDVPDLECLIVGPCYQLLDYLDDKAECYAIDYGVADAVCPAAATEEATIVVPPNVSAGGALVDESVRLFLDDATVIIHGVDTGAGDDASNYWAGDNLFTAWDGDNNGANMNQLGVVAGDVLYTKTGELSLDYKKTIKELCFILKDTGTGAATVNFQDLVAGDVIEILEDEAATSRNGTYTVKRRYVENGTAATDVIVIEDAANLIGGAGDVYIRVTSAAGVVKINQTTGDKVNIADWCHARTTTDFATDNSATAEYRVWRVERTVYDVELVAANFSIDEITHAVTLNAAITTLVGGLAKTVSYGKVYMEYRALRQDLQGINEVSSAAGMELLMGKLDARNPLHVGAYLALANTSTPVKVYGLGSDDMAGYIDFIESTSTIRNLYAIVPLTYSTSIIGYLKTIVENYADPNYVLDNGTKQKFRVILGGVDLTTQKDVISALGSATSAVVAGSNAATGLKKLAITVEGTLATVATTGTGDWGTDGVVPGDILTMVLDDGTTYGPYTIAHVNTGLSLTISSETGATDFPAGLSGLTNVAGDTISIADAEGTDKSVLTFIDATDYFTLADAAVGDQLYLSLTLPNAEFVSSGVVPGDILQIPLDPENPDWTDAQSWIVGTVESETRLTIVNSGPNSPTAANELPHGIKRDASATDRVVTDTDLYARVTRNMGKSEQVTYMLEIAQSIDSKRVVLCYPDEITVTDLVDGGAERYGAADPVAAGRQAGYYLACAVGGQTAGQPPQQGFTNLGINGVDRIYNSTDYFEEQQLTDLSNGGVYVFTQDNPDSLPYSVHEVTTDVLSLETGEYMVIKDFDFVAWALMDVLWGFIGKWNINSDTIKFIRQAMASSINNLKSRTVPKIGPPLLSASIDSIEQNLDLSADRLEVKCDVSLPMVLNTIGLHLIA